MLADYIVEDTCIGVEGVSSGYAERVFDCANEKQIEHLLVNLGRLDWRRSNGDPSESRLLDGVWSRLKPVLDYYDPHISAVKSVAYYQPLKAIEFAERLMRNGKCLKQLPEVFQYAAYNLQHVQRACEGLWELGKRDGRPLNSHADHPIRILARLCEVQPNKPFEYNEQIVTFGLAIAERPESWNYTYSPYDMLKPIFMTEGHTTSSSNFALTFRPYFISSKFVAPLRSRVLGDIISRLSGNNLRVAVKAADALSDAFRYPIGMFNAKVSNKNREEWTGIFVEGLERVERAVLAGSLDPLVLLTIWRSLSWHAHYAKGKTSTVVKRIRALMPDSLDFRTLVMMFDGYGMEMRRIDAISHPKKWEKQIADLTADLMKAYPNAEDLRNYISGILSHIRENSPESAPTPHVLYESINRASVDYSRATLENALLDDGSVTQRFVPVALAKLWDHSPDEARVMIDRLVKSGREQLCAAVGQAYYRVLSSGAYNEQDTDLLSTLIADERKAVARSAIDALRALPEEKADSMISLAMLANIRDSHELADELCTLFTWNGRAGFNRLTAHEVIAIFEKLMAIPELRGHWLETFLSEVSERFPLEAAAFFMRRTEKAVSEENWDYRPINHGPYVHVSLKFRKTKECAALLKTVAGWIKARDKKDVLFNYRSRELFEAMFSPFDEEIVEFFDGWLVAADTRDVELIGSFLGEAHHEFVFKHRDFVERFLEKARQLGEKSLKQSQGALYGAAIGGIRTGAAGEPMPRDIKMKELSEEVLRTLPRFSPSFELYDMLRKHAEAEIADSRRTREAYED